MALDLPGHAGGAIRSDLASDRNRIELLYLREKSAQSEDPQQPSGLHMVSTPRPRENDSMIVKDHHGKGQRLSVCMQQS
ncbi:hypothetical protein LEMLEM_LOCUS3720, partial [Lemmus lemmus]